MLGRLTPSTHNQKSSHERFRERAPHSRNHRAAYHATRQPSANRSAVIRLNSPKTRSSLGPMPSTRAMVTGRAGIPGLFPGHGVKPGSAFLRRCARPEGFSTGRIAREFFLRPPPANSIDRVRTETHSRADQGLDRAWRKKTGRWPTVQSGEIPGEGGLTWRRRQQAPPKWACRTARRHHLVTIATRRADASKAVASHGATDSGMGKGLLQAQLGNGPPRRPVESTSRQGSHG